ncbi:alpha/beta hydrolase [Aquitalea sp. FJL05]|uniref:alpha/beta fold hydrolase n=1 Tax=Aquitalea TaxID=407217 RepID=UPI000F5970FB|nr:MULTISPECIES: alpha/beta hydrolase [Aquitalea]RQO73352.1 alpha/beta hydrolase [Aquitalea sp. FJL05]
MSQANDSKEFSSKNASARLPRDWKQKLLALAGVVLTLASTPSQAAPTIRNIVLVHGAFADGSSWSPVISRLQRLGYHVSAVQNPLTSLADDVAATEKVLQRQTGDVLLVGHSWAGAVITQAGNDPKVKGLVYLSALVPDSNESVSELLTRLHAPMEGLAADEHGMLWLDQPAQFRQVMAADVPLKQVRLLAAVQQPIASASFGSKIGHAAWRDKPRWYVHTTRDQALPPEVQLRMARQIGATVWSVPSSHLSMISRPAAIASLLDQAARAASR